MLTVDKGSPIIIIKESEVVEIFLSQKATHVKESCGRCVWEIPKWTMDLAGMGQNRSGQNSSK